jgi:hypothetical protein
MKLYQNSGIWQTPQRLRSPFFVSKNRSLVGQIFDWLKNQFGEVSKNTILIAWGALNSVYWAQGNHLC